MFDTIVNLSLSGLQQVLVIALATIGSRGECWDRPGRMLLLIGVSSIPAIGTLYVLCILAGLHFGGRVQLMALLYLGHTSTSTWNHLFDGADRRPAHLPIELLSRAQTHASDLMVSWDDYGAKITDADGHVIFYSYRDLV